MLLCVAGVQPKIITVPSSIGSKCSWSDDSFINEHYAENVENMLHDFNVDRFILTIGIDSLVNYLRYKWVQKIV